MAGSDAEEMLVLYADAAANANANAVCLALEFARVAVQANL